MKKINKSKFLIGTIVTLLLVAAISSIIFYAYSKPIDFSRVSTNENYELNLKSTSNTDEALDEIIEKAEKDAKSKNSFFIQGRISDGLYYISSNFVKAADNQDNIAVSNETKEKILYYSCFIMKYMELNFNVNNFEKDGSSSEYINAYELAENAFLYMKFDYRNKDAASTYLIKTKEVIEKFYKKT